MSLVEETTKLFRLDPHLLGCPHTVFDRLREEAPVTYSPEVGCWLVTRYDDIVHVARHPDVFSSALPTGPVLARQMHEAMREVFAARPELAARMARRPQSARVLLSADPPDHARQRKLVNRAFTPPKVKALEPRIQEVADALVDAFVDRGEVELVHDFGVPLPLTIIAECLGVPKQDMPTFERWSGDFVAAIGNHAMTTEQLGNLLQSQVEFLEYFSAKVAERRAEPHDDLISDIVHAVVDGRPLDEPEMLSMFSQFLVAGNETTTKLLASGLRILAEDPALQQRLREGPTEVAGFVEEALRLEAPVQGVYRTAMVDTEVGGVEVPAGSHVMIIYAAGNRDGRVFPDPGTLDPGRANAMKHLAFGHGEHYCLGSALARAEGRIGIETLLRRCDAIRIADEHLEYEPSYVLHGLRRLRLSFTKRA